MSMILFNGPNTPFGRLALATALELGIEVENKVINVFEAEFLDPINPMRQIPTLLFDNGRAMFDSRVICAYFCSLHPGRGMNPVEDGWDVQTRWALALGLMESGVERVMELQRPAREQGLSVIEKCERRIGNVIDKLEAAADQICFEDSRIDRLATAVALEYTDFRIRRDWRDRAPRLQRWLEAESMRPSLAATRPKERSAVQASAVEP